MPLTFSGRSLVRITAGGVLASTLVAGVTVPAAAWEFPGVEIAEQAEAAPRGGYGGQCKVFAEQVVNKVLKKNGVKARVTGYGTPGGAYYGAYESAGGVQVDPAWGERGDLIQVITPRAKNKDFPPTRDKHNESILHTAIILERLEPGVYRVRDSNYVGYETIGTHRWNPLSWRERGVEVYVWRFGRLSGAQIMPSLHVGAGVSLPDPIEV